MNTLRWVGNFLLMFTFSFTALGGSVWTGVWIAKKYGILGLLLFVIALGCLCLSSAFASDMEKKEK
jgi:hypothetical protein